MGVKFSVAVVIQGIDKATAPIARVQAAINRARRPFDEISNRVKRLSEAAGLPRLQSAASGAASAVGNLAGQVKTAAFRFVGAGAAIAGITYGIARSFLLFGDELADTSTKLGINAETLQEWRYAAKLANVEQEGLDTGISRFSRVVGQAMAGSRGARDVVAQIGATAFTVTGQVRPLEELLPLVADHLKALKSPYERAAFAQGLFGRGGARLIPMLLNGSEGLAAMGKEARALGLILSNQTVAGADVMNDELDKSIMVIMSLKNTIGAQLAPTVVDIAKRISAWVVKNRPEIERLARAFAESLPKAIDRVVEAFRGIMKIMRPLIALWDLLAAALGPAPALLLAIGAAITISLIPSILSTIGALYTLSAALLGTPAGWVILAVLAIAAAFAALVAGIVLVIMNWDALATRFPKLAAIVQTFAKAGLGFLLEQLALVAAMVMSVAQEFETLVGLLPDWLLDLVGAGPTTLKVAASGAPAAPADPFGIPPSSQSQVADLIAALRQASSTTPGAPVNGPAVGRTRLAAAGGRVERNDSRAAVQVDFKNMPPGVRVTPQPSPGVDLDLKLGYSMAGP